MRHFHSDELLAGVFCWPCHSGIWLDAATVFSELHRHDVSRPYHRAHCWLSGQTIWVAHDRLIRAHWALTGLRTPVIQHGVVDRLVCKLGPTRFTWSRILADSVDRRPQWLVQKAPWQGYWDHDDGHGVGSLHTSAYCGVRNLKLWLAYGIQSYRIGSDVHFTADCFLSVPREHRSANWRRRCDRANFMGHYSLSGHAN